MTAPRDRDELLSLADDVLASVPAGTDAEVSLAETTNALTRYANGAIHQSVTDTALRVRVRLVRDGRCGVAEATSADATALRGLVAVAETVRAASVAGEVVPLYVPDGGADSDIAWCDATASFSAEQRADAVALVCDAARAQGQLAFGTFETNLVTRVMVSTTGLRRSGRSSDAEMIAMCRTDDASAYAARYGNDASAIDPHAVAAEVTERCARNRGATPVDPGDYEVVFAPYATGEMLEYLGYMGFSALAVQEERSFMRLGERLMSPRVTIGDNVHHRGAAAIPFDGEGATTRPVAFVDAGTCTAVVHDSVTAARAGVHTTGHSLAQPNTDGPYPRVLTMAAGDSTVDDLVSEVERGLLVTRMWYVRPVHPGRTIITGMTRDGTFVIEKGRVRRPVADLRFTQSIVDALADVRGVGAERLSVRGFFGAIVAPALHMGSFTFSS